MASYDVTLTTTTVLAIVWILVAEFLSGNRKLLVCVYFYRTNFETYD